MAEILHCTLLKMNQSVHTCHLCIGTCRFQRLGINVISLNICPDICIDAILRFLKRIIPAFTRNQMFPVFCKERTVHSRCHICRDHCRLNRESTTSAKRVDKDSVFIPWSQHDKRCCKCFSDRSLDSHLTIPSLMKGNTGSIDADRCNIFHKRNTDREACPIFLEP